MTTGKTIALTRWTLVGKVMSLLFNMQRVMQKCAGCDGPHRSVAEISYCTSEVRAVAERSYSTFKVRRGGCEEIPLIQGKEQWLHFPGAAMKRYPTSKIRETQVRW